MGETEGGAEMPNVFDYLTWRGDLSLEQAPFNDVDGLIMSSLSYASLAGLVPPEGITLAGAARGYFAGGQPAHPRGEKGGFWDKVDALLWQAGGSVRFGGVRLLDCTARTDREAAEQFAALAADLGAAGGFVSFQGTDDTLVGWKEDFNMAFITPVPAQREAAEYLERWAPRLGNPLRVGGHSKGGNMAVYAAVHASPAVRGRLEAVYNNDGPGFCENALDPAGYRAASGKIRTFLPQNAVVGMLLDHQENYTVVRSTRQGLFQHDLFSWQVEGPDFVRLEEVSGASRFASDALRRWVTGLSVEQRERFVDALFQVLEGPGALTVGELAQGGVRSAAAMLLQLRDMDEETRRALFQVLGALVKAAGRSAWDWISPLRLGGE